MTRRVTVCAACLRASCWHGEFMCDEARSAGTVEIFAPTLRKLSLEHPSNYSPKKIREVCGDGR